MHDSIKIVLCNKILTWSGNSMNWIESEDDVVLQGTAYCDFNKYVCTYLFNLTLITSQPEAKANYISIL